jgi:predicted transcriptional regulator
MVPQSLIREDDVEVYLRATSYRNKVSKLVNKFISRLKWLPMQHRSAIFE